MPLSSGSGIEQGLHEPIRRKPLAWLKHNQHHVFTSATGLFVFLSLIPSLKRLLGVDPALIGAIIGAYPLLKYAGIGLFKRKDLTAGVLVSVALLASLAIGEYFAAAEVAFIMLLGELLENATIAKAGKAVEKLVALTPKKARIRTAEGEVEIPAEELMPGQTVLVRAGESIPADGRVKQGNACVNQAALTGESLPCDKCPGDEVWAGTVSEEGYLEIEVKKSAGDTTIAQIGRIAAEAQARRPRIQRLADRWARYLVPASMATALFVWMLTGDLVCAVTILIVFCPCALVLATPTAIVAAVGHAARKGILIKSGAALEAAGRIDLLVLDKTGTLTIGEPSVASIVELRPSETQVLQLAASVEQCSNHPLAKAVMKAYGDKSTLPPATAFRSQPGGGIMAEVAGRTVLVGKAAFLAGEGITIEMKDLDKVEGLRRPGQTTVLVAYEGKCLGALLIGDTIRPDASASIAALNGMGVETIMATGDEASTAKEVAGACGVREAHARLLPQQKAELIEKYRKRRRRVAMAGDGINDTPALVTADLGIAMGTGAVDIAVEAGDVAILSENVSKIAELIGLAKRTLRVIGQNLLASAVINLIAVTAAAFGLLGPVAGALVHNAGSVLVILNAARLMGGLGR